jgi:hypothetical protein
MNRDNRSSSNDPTAEPARDQPDKSSKLVNLQPLDTPRRYDQPIEDDDDPVMPSDETTLNTKI